jgi:hypothetical protein
MPWSAEGEGWAVLSQKFEEARVVGKDVDWPRLDLGEHALVEVLDFEGHGEC